MTLRIRALPQGRTVIFDGLQGFARHPTDSNRFEFTGTFLEAPPNRPQGSDKANRYDLGIPLIFLPLFSDGSAWQDQSLISSRQFNRMRKLKTARLRVDHLSERFVHRLRGKTTTQLDCHVVSRENLGQLPQDAKVNLLGTAPFGPVSIAWGEFVRFYLCSFGMILTELLQCAQAGGDLSYLCRYGETRLENRVLYMVPLGHLRDRASILQAGMILADPQLRREVLRIARMLMGDALDLPLGGYVPSFPEGTTDLKVQYSVGQENLRDSGGEISYFRRITAIRADFRPASFDRIVVELPSQLENGDKPDGEDVHEFREAVRTYADIELSIESRAGKGWRQLSAPIAWQRFRDGFPAYSDAVVDVIPAGERRLLPIVLPRKYTRHAEGDATVGGLETDGGLTRLRSNARSWVDPEPPDRELLNAIGRFEYPVLAYPETELTYAFQQLAQAGEALLRAADGQVVGELPRCFQLPPSWGSYALNAKRQPRRFLTFAFDALPGIAHVVDFERGAKDVRTSIGIIARSDGGMMSDIELFACVRSAVRHISGSSRHVAKNVHNQTIWPSANVYIDVTSRPLRHQQRWLRNPDRFALALSSAAAQLFD